MCTGYRKMMRSVKHIDEIKADLEKDFFNNGGPLDTMTVKILTRTPAGEHSNGQSQDIPWWNTYISHASIFLPLGLAA